MDQGGQVLRTARVPNLRAEIEKFLEGGETMEAVIETGRSSYTMVDVLEEMGVAVKIAHPLCARRGIAGRGLSVNPSPHEKEDIPAPRLAGTAGRPADLFLPHHRCRRPKRFGQPVPR
jgi:hypothetical protein